MGKRGTRTAGQNKRKPWARRQRDVSLPDGDAHEVSTTKHDATMEPPTDVEQPIDELEANKEDENESEALVDAHRGRSNSRAKAMMSNLRHAASHALTSLLHGHEHDATVNDESTGRSGQVYEAGRIYCPDDAFQRRFRTHPEEVSRAVVRGFCRQTERDLVTFTGLSAYQRMQMHHAATIFGCYTHSVGPEWNRHLRLSKKPIKGVPHQPRLHSVVRLPSCDDEAFH